MSEVTVTYKVEFGKKRPQESAAGPSASKPRSDPTSENNSPVGHAGSKPPASRTARLLALAYLVERLVVEDGRLENYSQAAKLFRLSRARMTQVMNLRWLPIRTQGAIILGEKTISERGLRGGKE